MTLRMVECIDGILRQKYNENNETFRAALYVRTVYQWNWQQPYVKRIVRNLEQFWPSIWNWIKEKVKLHNNFFHDRVILKVVLANW